MVSDSVIEKLKNSRTKKVQIQGVCVRVVEDDHKIKHRAWTDLKYIYFKRSTLKDPDIKALIAHELLHCKLPCSKPVEMRGKYNNDIMNMASDIFINETIKRETGVLIHDGFYKEMGVFKELLKTDEPISDDSLFHSIDAVYMEIFNRMKDEYKVYSN
jgi:hypothetical protein